MKSVTNLDFTYALTLCCDENWDAIYSFIQTSSDPAEIPSIVLNTGVTKVEKYPVPALPALEKLSATKSWGRRQKS